MTIDDPTSLNRSYDTSRAGRQTRSAAAAARSSARRTRVRSASSTPSVPATTTVTADDGDQMMAAQEGGVQVNDASGLLTSFELYATLW